MTDFLYLFRKNRIIFIEFCQVIPINFVIIFIFYLFIFHYFIHIVLITAIYTRQ